MLPDPKCLSVLRKTVTALPMCDSPVCVPPEDSCLRPAVGPAIFCTNVSSAVICKADDNTGKEALLKCRSERRMGGDDETSKQNNYGVLVVTRGRTEGSKIESAPWKPESSGSCAVVRVSCS